jgi:WD40 repeat protein
LLRVWNVGTGMEVKKLGPTKDWLYGVTLSHDGKAVATIGYAGTITVWNIDEGKETFSHKREKKVAYCIAFSPDGKYLVTGHDDHNCYVTPLEAPK